MVKAKLSLWLFAFEGFGGLWTIGGLSVGLGDFPGQVTLLALRDQRLVLQMAWVSILVALARAHLGNVDNLLRWRAKYLVGLGNLRFFGTLRGHCVWMDFGVSEVL